MTGTPIVRAFILYALVTLFLAVTLQAQPIEVSHPVVNFLRRLEEKGLIAPGFWSTLPRDTKEVARVLNQTKLQESSLHAWDRQKLERYLNEFDRDLRRANTPLDYRDESYSVIADFEYYTGIYTEDSIPQIHAAAFGTFTPRVEGTYRDFAYLTAGATVGMDRNLHDRFASNFEPARGLPYTIKRDAPKSDASTFDAFRVIVGLGDEHLSMEAGQDWNQWGPGNWQHTTLSARPHFWVADSLAPSPSDSRAGFPGTATNFSSARRGYRYPGEGPPLPQVRLRMAGTRWEYVKIAAQRMGLTKDSATYLVAHRLQLRIGALTFGATEMLTIGTRGIEGLLLIPGIPLKFAEHSAGDQDNSSMSADVEWTIAGHGRVYGEFFLDDFSGPPLNFWGNKFSWLLGGSWQDPLGLPAELHAEYARVDPWVYGHHLYGTQMQSYGALLGSSLPPNSHAVTASASFPLPMDASGLVEYGFRQRDLKSRGSSIFDDYYSDIFNPAPEEPVKQFLRRDVETRNEVVASAQWFWNRYLQLRLGMGGLWVANYRGNPGVTLATPLAFGEVWLRY